MKLFVVSAVLGLLISLAGSTPAHDEKKDRQPTQKIERSTIVDPNVTVTLCVMSGTLKVRGWDKNEIHVSSMDATAIDFRRIDKGKDTSVPAHRIDVMILDQAYKSTKGDCQAAADVEMDVPVGATVQVQTRDGDIAISGVAAAYAGSQNGDIRVERASKLVEAGSVGGSIVLKDSSGRVNLSSAGGGVDVVNLKEGSPDDTLEVGTVSGDIQLEKVGTRTVITKTVNGTTTMTGALAKGGNYAFTSMGGDINLIMPKDASFRLNAKVAEVEDLQTDFTLKYLPDPPAPAAKPKVAPAPEAAPKTAPTTAPKPPAVKSKGAVATVVGQPEFLKVQPLRTSISALSPNDLLVLPNTLVVGKSLVVPYGLHRVTAICGSGDATISVSAFAGTVRLKKM